MKKILTLGTGLLSLSLAWGQAPLFSLLPSEHTGVDFKNQVVDTKKDNILIYSNFYGGAGVGIGDFNGDGLPDLYFAGNQVGDRVYFNRGKLTFEDVTDEAGILDRGGWSSGVVVADVNRDGWDDVYVTKELYDWEPELRRNELYLNQGDGTFREVAAAYGVDHDARTRHATFIDYDKDGWLDLYLLNQPPNPGNFSDMYDVDKKQAKFASRLFRNTGKGRFEEVTEQAGIFNVGFPNSVTASDLNNDGWPDLYVANDFAAPDWLYLNNGDGTFTNVIDDTHRHISYFSMGVDAGDLNNDGWLDVMVLDMQAEDNFRIKANMSGMDPAAFWKVVDDGGHYQYMYNAVHLNQGTLDEHGKGVRFSDIAQLTGMSSTDWSWSNLMADFDNDGHKDVFVTNGLLRDIRNTDADKKFSLHVQEVANKFIQENPNAGAVTIWDILDLESSLKMIPSVPLQNYAYKNNGDLSFTKVIEDWGFEEETFSNGCAYADLDQDGDLDLVINNLNEEAYIYRNNLSEQQNRHYLRVKLTDKAKQRGPHGARVRIVVNGQPQWYEFTSVRGMYSTSEQVAHFGLGDHEQVDLVEVSWWDGTVSRLEKVEADQEITLDARSGKKPKKQEQMAASPLFRLHTEYEGLAFEHEENEFDDYLKQVLLPHKMSQFGPALVAGDVDGDGLEDLFVGGAMGQPGRLFRQTPNGFKPMKAKALEADKAFEDVDAALLDYDMDGDLDLYVVSGGNAHGPGAPFYQDRMYENDGSGTFVRNAKVLPSLTESGSVVRPFDIDKDGDLDLFVGGRHVPWDYPSPASSRLLENQGGRFKDVTAKWAKELLDIGLVTDAQWTDVDQDGLADLMLVGEWMPITIFQQGEEHHFERSTAFEDLKRTQGWWYSLLAEDMDGDGDEDYVLGNLGLNYKYKATPEEPFEVFYDDFDNNGSHDIVLSYYNFGKQYPLRGRSCSSQQVPALKKKFPTYELFASSELSDVYGATKLKKALNYQATTFASMYVENLGNGAFRLSELPNEAQLSSLNALLAEDVDEDGIKDLLVAGNLFVAEVETPRNDAGVGLLLKGVDGHGFRAVPATESGVMLPFDVKKMVKLPTADGRSLIVVACNDDALRILSRE